MSKVKLRLDERTKPELVDLAGTIVLSMTGNANYTTPDPALLVITSAANDLDNKIVASEQKRQQWLQSVSEEDVLAGTLREKLTLEGTYVQLKSAGDEAKILSAGMEVQDERTPAVVPPQVENLRGSQGDEEGEIDLVWDSLKNKAQNYSVRYREEVANAPWIFAPENPTKSKYSVKNLVPGKTYRFEVAGNNAAGRGGYSEPAIQVAG